MLPEWKVKAHSHCYIQSESLVFTLFSMWQGPGTVKIIKQYAWLFGILINYHLRISTAQWPSTLNNDSKALNIFWNASRAISKSPLHTVSFLNLFAFYWFLPEDTAFPTALSSGFTEKILGNSRIPCRWGHCLWAGGLSSIPLSPSTSLTPSYSPPALMFMPPHCIILSPTYL